jgi:hypothetical protein
MHLPGLPEARGDQDALRRRQPAGERRGARLLVLEQGIRDLVRDGRNVLHHERAVLDPPDHIRRGLVSDALIRRGLARHKLGRRWLACLGLVSRRRRHHDRQQKRQQDPASYQY